MRELIMECLREDESQVNGQDIVESDIECLAEDESEFNNNDMIKPNKETSINARLGEEA